MDIRSQPSSELQMLEPTPLTTPEIPNSANLPSLPTSSSEGTGQIARYLIRTQQISSYVFTGFLGIHWVTTGVLPLVSDLETADNSLLLSRVLYQNEIIEPCIVLGSLGAHVLSGVILRGIRRVKQFKNYGRVTWVGDLNIIQGTGYLLAPLVAAHVGITRVLPLFKDGGSESIGVAFLGHGFVQVKHLSWFIYPTIVAIGTCHVVQGWARWLGYPRRWRIRAACLMTVVSSVWLSSVVRISRIGRVGGHLGRHYDELYNVISGVGCTL